MKVDVKYNLKIIHPSDEYFPELTLFAMCVCEKEKHSFEINLLSKFKCTLPEYGRTITKRMILEDKRGYEEYMLWLNNLDIKNIIIEQNNTDMFYSSLASKKYQNAYDNKKKIKNDYKEFINKNNQKGKFSYDYEPKE